MTMIFSNNGFRLAFLSTALVGLSSVASAQSIVVGSYGGSWGEAIKACVAAKQPADDHPDFAAWQEEMQRVYGTAELIVAKQRHGATGKVRMRFDAKITKFSDAVDSDYLPEMRS